MQINKTRFVQGLLNFRNMNRINGDPNWKDNLTGLAILVGLPYAMYSWLSRNETWSVDCREVALRDRVDPTHRAAHGVYKTGTNHIQAIETFSGVALAADAVFGPDNAFTNNAREGGEYIVTRAQLKCESEGDPTLFWGEHVGLSKYVPALPSSEYDILSRKADTNFIHMMSEYRKQRIANKSSESFF